METPANPYSTPSANLYGAPAGVSSDIVAPSTIAQLTGTKPWVRFMSVMMWIGVIFMLLAAGAMAVVAAIGKGKLAGNSPFGDVQFIALAAIYVFFAVLYIIPATKLWKYANRIGSLAASHSLADLDKALNEQRGFWKFVGVMMIIMLSLYLIAIIGVVALGTTAALKSGAFPVK
ncbi:DUF5362 family protein [Prosthecobacter vanneervenii]|uniref:Uncharacterized membrane protein YhaH (DUF805 family) n=1 Tax=Prosthecobacter vanneervenii TaxID=48466 RepID=A0A7W7YC90_9BACT|nr:DUF5362 family protein [Prosthecobacter vanneervenii]MBB5033523.1 uncharacterized membrane protein YhaH (DUF805 family) [Prosthecobacter vanneervenii]